MTSRSQPIKTPLATIAFAQSLFKLRQQDGYKPSYGATFLFDKGGADLSALSNAVMDVIKDEWPNTYEKLLEMKAIKLPFLDGDGPQGLNRKTMERWPGFENRIFIRSTATPDFKPQIVDRRLAPITEIADCPSGSKVYAVLTAFAWTNQQQQRGVSFGVSNVQVVHKAEGDEVLGGGGVSIETFFEPLELDTVLAGTSIDKMFG